MHREERAGAADELAREGIVVIPDHMPSLDCDRLRADIEETVRSDDLDTIDAGTDYASLAVADRPVVNRRGGRADEGMIDVFHLDFAVAELASFRDDPEVSEIIELAAGKRIEPTNLNVYINRSVTSTRGYHADTFAEKYKSFLYLTDVETVDDGPLSYLPGTHRPGKARQVAVRLANRARSRPATEAAFFDDAGARHLLAPRGTLIIADQTGLHRGMPQRQGSYRMLVTVSYMAERRPPS